MDAKETSIVKHYYDKLDTLSFDEKDIYPFLILIREVARKHELVLWELANFVAHRERDRGEFWEVLSKTKAFFNGDGVKLGDVFEVKPVFDDRKIRNALTSLLSRLGFGAISDPAANGVILCIMALLHTSRILKKDGSEVGQLLFAYDKHQIYLFGRFSVKNMIGLSHLQVPVLQITNDYLNPTNDGLQEPRMVEIVNQGGSLRVVES